MTTNKTTTSEPRRRGRPAKASLDAAAVIRAAALNAFAQFGFNGVSIVEIAKAAAVAKPLIHYHFASKEELWQAAVGEAFLSLQAELKDFQQQLANRSPVDAIRQVARQLITFASKHPQLVRIVVDETGKSGPRAEWLYERYLLPSYTLAKLLLDGLKTTQAANINLPSAEHLVPIILGVMNFAFLDAVLIRKAYGADVYAEAYIEQHAELLSKMLMSFFLPAK